MQRKGAGRAFSRPVRRGGMYETWLVLLGQLPKQSSPGRGTRQSCFADYRQPDVASIRRKNAPMKPRQVNAQKSLSTLSGQKLVQEALSGCSFFN
jgi:hypothetical protein